MSTSTNPPIVIPPFDVTPGPRRASAARRHERAAERRRRHAAHRVAGGPVNISLWIPSTAIFVLLAPFALLLTPLLYLAPRDVMPSPVRTVAGLGAVLLSLGGTVVDVDASDCRIHLRLF
jgi:hypothetical protein